MLKKLLPPFAEVAAKTSKSEVSFVIPFLLSLHAIAYSPEGEKDPHDISCPKPFPNGKSLFTLNGWLHVIPASVEYTERISMSPFLQSVNWRTRLFGFAGFADML